MHFKVIIRYAIYSSLQRFLIACHVRETSEIEDYCGE